jgi:hypothetical protein
MSNAIVPNGGTSIERDGFEGRSLEKRHETASTAIAAQAQAEIQARYVVAMQHRRDDDDVRARLLKECRRPNFAARGYYSVPRKGAVGRLTGTRGRVEGLSVRFAEAAIRLMGNILQSTRTTYDDDFKRLINVSATDLETNAVYQRDFILEKTVERRNPDFDNDVILGKRTNTDGEIVYVVQSTEADLLTKESGLVSRMFRTEAIRFLPADTTDECEREIIRTVQAKDAKDPDAARKEIADGFAALNVLPADLKSYLGHDLAQCSPAQLTQLRGLWVGIRDGAVTWADVMTEKAAGEGGEGRPAAKTVAEKLAERAAKKPPAPTPTAPAPAAQEGGAKGPAKAKAPAPPVETPKGTVVLLCAVCDQPVTEGVSMLRADGSTGIRHKGCPAPGLVPRPEDQADSPPPDDVKTVGREREPGEEG